MCITDWKIIDLKKNVMVVAGGIDKNKSQKKSFQACEDRIVFRETVVMQWSCCKEVVLHKFLFIA